MGAVSKKARRNQYRSAMERYYWYKAAGICPRCLKYSVPGMVYCADCYEKNRRHATEKDPDHAKKNAYAKERRAKLKAEGLCVDCGKRKAMDGRIRCAKCHATAQDSRIKYKIHQRTLKGESQ